MKFTTTSQIRSKCDWYEHGKKSTNFFVFRKTTRISKYNKKLVVDNKEITDQTDILEHMRLFSKHGNKKLR